MKILMKLLIFNRVEKMNRLFIPAGLIIASLAFAGCQKSLQEVSPAEPSEPDMSFTIFAEAPSYDASAATRTANDGLHTKWVAGDAINIFHSEAGKSAYKSDGKFTVSDADAGSFAGSLSETLSGSSDWFALYPYSADNAALKSVVTVASASQTQTGNGSKAHLAGETFPLWGKLTSVAAADAPTFTMSQLASVAKVHLTNNSSSPLTVSSVKLTATEEIAGEFTIDFTPSAPEYTAGASNVSKEVTLTVTDGTAIAVGGSADFYIALKPFTATSGTVLKIAVNGYEKTNTLTKNITFSAGEIQPVNFNYNKPAIVIDQTYAASNGYCCAVNEKSLTLSATVPGGYTESQISWKSSDESIATVSGGVVTYAGGFGDVTITAEIEGVESGSIALSVPCGLVRETFHNQNHYSFDHAAQSGNGTSTSSVWHDGYLEITTYQQDANATKQRGDIKCTDLPVTFHAGNYPIIAVKVEDVKDLYNTDGVTDRNIKMDLVASISNEDGSTTEYKKFANEANNAYKNDYKCSDGSHVYVYDLTEQQFRTVAGADATELAPTDKSMSMTTFNIKYADIKTVSKQLTYKLYWIQTFKSKDDVKAYIENVDKLTYTVVK